MIKVKNRTELREIVKERYQESVDNKTYTIDVGDIDTSDMNFMCAVFDNLNMLREIKCLENWDVSGVSDISYMFNNCEHLKKIKGIEKWDVSNVKDMDKMFCYCESLEHLDLSNWNTPKLKNVCDMFYYCPLEYEYRFDINIKIEAREDKERK